MCYFCPEDLQGPNSVKVKVKYLFQEFLVQVNHTTCMKYNQDGQNKIQSPVWNVVFLIQHIPSKIKYLFQRVSVLTGSEKKREKNRSVFQKEHCVQGLASTPAPVWTILFVTLCHPAQAKTLKARSLNQSKQVHTHNFNNYYYLCLILNLVFIDLSYR